MIKKVVATLPAVLRPLLEPRLPEWVEPRWFSSVDEAVAMGPGSEIGWFDMYDAEKIPPVIVNACDLKWLNTIYAGIDNMPVEDLLRRGVKLTNGAGINAITIAEYVVMGMLTIAKGYREVVRAQERRDWLLDAPGKGELYESKALVVGYGAIGQLVEERLKAFGVQVTCVRRSKDQTGRTLGPTQWRSQLGEFDWVIVAVPATKETEHMIGTTELSAMKGTAVLLNVARGSVIDQAALVDALKTRTIAAAFLDVTDPEPLPADHPLWSLDNAHITMHLSGRSQTRMLSRSAERFLKNLERYLAGTPFEHQVDLARGY